jgi:hypothetical protein
LSTVFYRERAAQSDGYVPVGYQLAAFGFCRLFMEIFNKADIGEPL